MDTVLEKLILEAMDKLLVIRDYVELKWCGTDLDWAHDQINRAISCIDVLLPEEEEDGTEFGD